MNTYETLRFKALLVDDHAVVRVGLKRILADSSSDWAIREVGSASAALDALAREHFGLAIIDLSMPGMTGLELVRRARAASPQMRILVLSMHDEEQYAIRSFKAGANGYLTKDSAVGELADAVHKLSNGGSYVSSGMAERMVLHMNGTLDMPSHASLSDRELDVLRRLVSGHCISEIARVLHLSVKTVSSHKSRILYKLQLPNTAAMFRYGIEHSLSCEAMDPDMERAAKGTVSTSDPRSAKLRAANTCNPDWPFSVKERNYSLR